MTLRQFLNSLPNGGQKALAEQLNISPAYLYQVAKGIRSASEQLSIKIERASDRKVTCEELRPDVDWAYLRQTVNYVPQRATDKASA